MQSASGSHWFTRCQLSVSVLGEISAQHTSSFHAFPYLEYVLVEFQAQAHIYSGAGAGYSGASTTQVTLLYSPLGNTQVVPSTQVVVRVLLM